MRATSAPTIRSCLADLCRFPALTDTGPAVGPKDFDICITLMTPFIYDPANGNLLMDVRNTGGGATTQFDAEETFGDSISRVWNTSSADATGNPDTLALVTQFSFTPVAVPEPSAYVAFAAGALGLLLWRRKMK